MTSSVKTSPQFQKSNSIASQSIVSKLLGFMKSLNWNSSMVKPENPNPSLNQSKSENITASSPAIVKDKRTPIIGVLGAKGGVGATTFSINLATALIDKFGNTVLLDTNLQQPDVALCLGLNPKYTLSDLIERRSRLDQKVLEACCEVIEFDSGSLNIVSPPLDLESSLTTDLSLLTQCNDKLKELSKMIVVDLPKQLDQNLLALLDICDKIVLVCEPSISSVTAAKRWLSVFNDLEYGKEDLCLLVNKGDRKQKQLETEAIKALNLKTNWHLPDSHSHLEQAALDGIPLAASHPKDPYCKAIKPIANQLYDWFSKEDN